MMNSSRAVNSAVGTKFRRFHFLLFYAILSSWSLIDNAKFDSDSSSLDRLTILARLARKNYKISHKI